MTIEDYNSLRVGDRLVNPEHREYSTTSKAYDGPQTIMTIVGWFNEYPSYSASGYFSEYIKPEDIAEWTIVGRAAYDNDRLRWARTLANV